MLSSLVKVIIFIMRSYISLFTPFVLRFVIILVMFRKTLYEYLCCTFENVQMMILLGCIIL